MEPAKVLNECIELQVAKGADYQNPNSEVKQAMYYPNGLLTLNDIIFAKMLRIKSLIEAHQHGGTPKNESLEDSYKDMINYCSFAVAWIRGKIDGQDPSKDILNKPTKLPAPMVKLDGLSRAQTYDDSWSASDSCTEYPINWQSSQEC